jgi:hypothetical protein
MLEGEEEWNPGLSMGDKNEDCLDKEETGSED